MLYFALHTNSLGSYFGFYTYRNYISENSLAFTGSDDSHIEEIPDVAVSLEHLSFFQESGR